MRLVTFEISEPSGPRIKPGLLMEQGVAELPFSSMLELLEKGEDALKAAREILQNPKTIHPLDSVRLRAPVPNPGAYRDFLAFEEHAKAGAQRRGESLPEAWYELPVYYKGNHREIYGPEDEIPWPSYTRRLDFELEVACVIGKKGRDLSPEEAADYIAGYTVLNDFSARDIQKREMACRMGPAKGKDFATSIGPYLLTIDESPGFEEEDIPMIVRVNGEEWSRGNFKSHHWKFPLMVSHVSQEETVYPGDILGSGTFYKGCGLDMDRWLKPGDVIELEVEKLGVLRNRIGKPKDQKELLYAERRTAERRGKEASAPSETRQAAKIRPME